MIHVAKTSITAIAAIILMCAGNAQTQQAPLPDVNVTAPAGTPNSVPRVVPPTEQNSYFGRNRVEEDMFVERPCSETRMSSSAGGKCLEGYHLGPGWGGASESSSTVCHIQLDVVSATTATYSFEADTFVFDPYLVTSGGPLPKGCSVSKEPAYDLARLQDMNSMTRRGTNWRGYNDAEDNGGRSAEYSDGRLNCLALRRLGPNWQGGVIWSVHAAICRLDGAPVQPGDVHAVLSSIKIRVYDSVGNLRPGSQSAAEMTVE
jgi:hypothetical protein